MSGGANFGSYFFGPGSLKKCQEIGLNIAKKGLAYIHRHTPDLTGKPLEYNPIEHWARENVQEPYNNWVSQSRKNASNYKSQYGLEKALSIVGKDCTIKKLYAEVFDTVSPATLMCQYLACVKLPDLNIQIPDFTVDPFPKVPIWGWYIELMKMLYNKFGEFIVRILCAFVRTILDLFLSSFCLQDLKEFARI